MYNSEGIKFDHVDYVDNQPVLDLIELKKTGIMSILDAQMKMPKADDKTFLIQVNKTHQKNKAYYKPYVKKEGHFIVNHYAGEVVYDVCYRLFDIVLFDNSWFYLFCCFVFCVWI